MNGSLLDLVLVGETDGFVVKYDRYEQELRARQFWTPDEARLLDISIDGSDGLCAVSWARGTFTEQEALEPCDKFLRQDSLVRKYDTSGRHILICQIGFKMSQIATAIQMVQRDLFLTGQTLGPLTG